MERMASSSLYIPASSLADCAASSSFYVPASPLADRAASLSFNGAGVKRGSIYTVKKGGKRSYVWGAQKNTLTQ